MAEFKVDYPKSKSQKSLLDLRRLNFGKAYAESDDYLSKDYVNNSALESVIFGRANIITGQKGSGKSAILRIISHILRYDVNLNQQENIVEYLSEIDGKVIIELNQTHNLDIYKFIVNQKTLADSDPEKFKLLWLCYIGVLVGQRIVEKEQFDLIEPQHFVDLKALLKPFKIEAGKSNLTEIVINKLKNIKIKVKLLFNAFDAEISHKESRGKRIVELDLFKLLDHENMIIHNLETTCWILIDKLDDFYKYNQEKMEALIKGLFLAVEELRDFPSIQPIVFIRTDIYERAGIKDADKFRDSKFEITWDSDETLRFLAKRLYHSPQIKNIIAYREFDKHMVELLIKAFFPIDMKHINKKGLELYQPFVTWFKHHLENGKEYISPRDIIVFLNKCVSMELKQLKSTGRTTALRFPIVSETSVKNAYKEISEEKFEDIKKLTGHVDLLHYLHDKKMRTFTFTKIKSMIKITGASRSEQQKEQDKLQGFISDLEALGFLKRKKTKLSGTDYIYSYEIPPLYTADWG